MKEERDDDCWSFIGTDRGYLCISSDASRARTSCQESPLGAAQAQEGPMTVFVDVNTVKQVGDKDHIRVFASHDAAETLFDENDPEGVAFEYDVLE